MFICNVIGIFIARRPDGRRERRKKCHDLSVVLSFLNAAPQLLKFTIILRAEESQVCSKNGEEEIWSSRKKSRERRVEVRCSELTNSERRGEAKQRRSERENEKGVSSGGARCSSSRPRWTRTITITLQPWSAEIMEYFGEPWKITQEVIIYCIHFVLFLFFRNFL